MHQVGCPNNYVQIKSHVSLDPSTGMLLHEEGTTIYEYQSGFCMDHFNSSENVIQLSAFVCRNATFKMVNKTLEGTCMDKNLVYFNKKLRTGNI